MIPGAKRIIDVTADLSEEMVTWEGVEPYSFEWVIRMDDLETTAHFDDESYVDANFANASFIHLTPHTGTHVDAPLHYDLDGETIDRIPLDRLIAPVRVVETGSARRIGPEMIDPVELEEGQGIVFKTRNSSFYPEVNQFHKDYTGVEPAGARAIVDRNIPLVGIDYLSVEPFEAYAEENHATHRHLLRNEVLIVEGLDLRTVDPGEYTLIALPLKLKGLEASPARAVLVKF